MKSCLCKNENTRNHKSLGIGLVTAATTPPPLMPPLSSLNATTSTVSIVLRNVSGHRIWFEGDQLMRAKMSRHMMQLTALSGRTCVRVRVRVRVTDRDKVRVRDRVMR